MTGEPGGRRVVVRSARTTAVRRSPGPSATREIDEQTALGEVLVRSLMRAQLRVALSVLALAAVVIGGIPVLLATAPGLAQVHVLGLPLTWLLLGVLVYPGVCLVAWGYVRVAERNERDFAELVDRT